MSGYDRSTFKNQTLFSEWHFDTVVLEKLIFLLYFFAAVLVIYAQCAAYIDIENVI